ncbi:hypothetical protein [Weissella minor]|uniref:Uncharacterized protein n=1 Tax=Weissella minor TaxID=1620 RepID=A0A0R2JHT7_9LACO|nr:hypothetical protein [Weissella minor]KRN76883.1 hypothetical protein IV67_GL000392 [Weissella minor]
MTTQTTELRYKPLSIIAIILASLAIALSFFPYANLFATIVALISFVLIMIFGFVNHNRLTNMAKSGLILAIVGFVFSIGSQVFYQTTPLHLLTEDASVLRQKMYDESDFKTSYNSYDAVYKDATADLDDAYADYEKDLKAFVASGSVTEAEGAKIDDKYATKIEDITTKASDEMENVMYKRTVLDDDITIAELDEAFESDDPVGIANPDEADEAAKWHDKLIDYAEKKDAALNDSIDQHVSSEDDDTVNV